MKTETLLKNENLWQRIQGFSLDAENAAFPFSKKLAKEENWSLEFTRKAIEEYKKFVYLCCISSNGASPSEIVDKVWHMHLIYTQNYWEDFCPNILKRSLHHHPSNGGILEKSKHENWFSETLENYKQIFQQEAPNDIWKNKNNRKKPKQFWNINFKTFALTGLLLMLFSCTDNEFSSFFITILVLIIGFFVLISFFSFIFGDTFSKNKNETNSNSDEGSCSGGGSSCSGSSGCGSGCGGGGCGGCGG